MVLNILKRDIAGPGDAADFGASLERYSLTDRAPVRVANHTEANQLAAQLVAADLTEAFPLFIWNADMQRHMCKPGPGDPWVTVGGRLHGAQARVDSNVPAGTITEMHVNETGFLRQSVGFTRAPNGGVRIPETGLYRVFLAGSIEGNINETGRRYVRIQLNGNNLGGRRQFDDDTHFSASTEWRFSQGDVIMPIAYQAMKDSAGQTKERYISATLGVYQSLDPSW